MPSPPFSKPVEDSVPKVDDDIAVGEDLDFQRRWWKFERATWIFFALLLLCDLSGLFGRGYLANVKSSTADQTLALDYERFGRGSTPSVMTLHFGPTAVHNGEIKVFVSDSIVKQLGAQRIAPQPSTSLLGNGGITYTFPASNPPAIAQISLSPSFPGWHRFTIQVVDGDPINGSIFVFP